LISANQHWLKRVIYAFNQSAFSKYCVLVQLIQMTKLDSMNDYSKFVPNTQFYCHRFLFLILFIYMDHSKWKLYTRGKILRKKRTFKPIVVLQQKGVYKDCGSGSKKENTRKLIRNHSFELKGQIFLWTHTLKRMVVLCSFRY
jgi:hypothetical protein